MAEDKKVRKQPIRKFEDRLFVFLRREYGLHKAAILTGVVLSEVQKIN